MDIEGRAFHVEGLDSNHNYCVEVLTSLLQAAFADVDSVAIEKDHNAKGSIDCITLSNVYVEREVLETLELAMQQYFGVRFYIYTNGYTTLVLHDDYVDRLNKAVSGRFARLSS